MTRLTKQLLYSGFYLVLIGLVVWGLYRSVVPAPTCTDGIQNQGEEGVDCGAVCGKSCPVALLPLATPEVQIVKYNVANADILIKLDNPNASYGAPQVPYTLTVLDANGQVLATRKGTTYVNPLESHYLVVPLVGLTAEPAKADLQLDTANVQWATLDVQAAANVEFAVRNDQLNKNGAGLRYSADVVNNSKFDFDQVEMAVILYDASGKIVGTGSTILSTITAGQLRGALVDWPFDVLGAVRGRAFMTTNIFNNDNFIRTYGSPEQFKNF